jgi:hypothetical protein
MNPNIIILGMVQVALLISCNAIPKHPTKPAAIIDPTKPAKKIDLKKADDYQEEFLGN